MINAFRHLNLNDINEIHRLTMSEYNLLMKGRKLRMIDDEYLVHLQSFTNQQIKATKGKGKNVKPVYETFESFFNYKELENEVLGVVKKTSEEEIKLMRLMSILNKKGG